MKWVLPALLFLSISTNAAAWTRASDERIAMKAAQLAPTDVKLLIERFEPEYKQGLARAQSDEGSDIHRYFLLSHSGKLRERIERESGGIIAAIRSRTPMAQVVERLGMLAHYVADANNPFHAANDDQRLEPSHDDFEQFFEQRLAKFPTVFYGLESHFRMSEFLDRTFARSAGFYPLLSEEYFRYGARRTSAEFDDRSTAFGVASVSYSRAVTDLANLYFYIWREAGGDVRMAPVLRGGNLLLNAN